jgi:hypothetical protein
MILREIMVPHCAIRRNTRWVEVVGWSANNSLPPADLLVKNSSRNVLYITHSLMELNPSWEAANCAANVLVRQRTIPTERPPLLGEVSASFSGERLSRGQRNESPRPLISIF